MFDQNDLSELCSIMVIMIYRKSLQKKRHKLTTLNSSICVLKFLSKGYSAQKHNSRHLSFDFIYSAPRYFNEFLSSLIAVSTSSNVRADTAQRACFCARAMAWSSIPCELLRLEAETVGTAADAGCWTGRETTGAGSVWGCAGGEGAQALGLG